MGTSSITVLIVDDFEPWRNFATKMLRRKPKLHVVSEASDGLEAVQKAQGLQPNMILLDIGLPTINGIQAARQILQHAPKTKILFVSEERSPDVVEEALRTGAGGYLVKSNAATELLPAVEAILRGKKFVSSSLMGPTVLGKGNGHIEPLRRQEGEYHEIKFHADYTALADDFAEFTKAALNNGNAVVIIATESLQTSISHRLRTNGGVDAERYFMYDISDPLSIVTVDDAVKAARQKGLHVALG